MASRNSCRVRTALEPNTPHHPTTWMSSKEVTSRPPRGGREDLSKSRKEKAMNYETPEVKTVGAAKDVIERNGVPKQMQGPDGTGAQHSTPSYDLDD